MNQILSTDMPNNIKKEKKPIATNSILKFLVIAMIIFGLCIIGSGAYALYQNQAEERIKNSEPTISLENKTDTVVLLKVVGQVNIAKIEYYWNDGKSTTVNGNSGKYLEAEITIPAGQNTLHIIVQDENGKETTYDKDYDIESNIQLEVIDDKIHITYSGDEVISYMTYRWDDEDEYTLQVDGRELDEEIDVMSGLHTLTVIVVDEENNTDMKVQKINGIAKPEINIYTDESKEHFVIKASSESNITRVEITIDQNEEQKYLLNLEGKEISDFTYTISELSIHDGDNYIEVVAYTEDNVTGDIALKVVK